MNEFGPGREVFFQADDPHKNRLSWRDSQEIFKAEHETGTETKEFIKGINFEVLKKTFEEEYKRSGLDPSQMNFISPEHIYSNAGWGNLGCYDAQANLLGFDAWGFKRFAAQRNLDERLTMLQGLCHEMTHAVEKSQVFVGKRGSREEDEYDHNGYSRKVETPDGQTKRKSVFNAFSEGVTDRIGLEMTSKYAEQTGFADTATIANFKKDFKTKSAYAWNQHVVDIVVTRLAIANDLRPEVIWEAIKAGAFRGDNLYQGELREFLDEELGSDFMAELQEDTIVKKKVVHDRTKTEQKLRSAKALILKMVRKITR